MLSGFFSVCGVLCNLLLLFLTLSLNALPSIWLFKNFAWKKVICSQIQCWEWGKEQVHVFSTARIVACKSTGILFFKIFVQKNNSMFQRVQLLHLFSSPGKTTYPINVSSLFGFPIPFRCLKNLCLLFLKQSLYIS